jgi:protein-glutamine gamma-glutamyltransferase
MKTRANIVAAARALNSSGAKFATFENTKGNPQFWTRTEKGELQLRQGVSPSVAIQDIFNQGGLYAFECATATVIILYKAVLDTLGAEIFNRNFSQLVLYDWNYDQDLGLISSDQIQEAYPGDVLYFKNPDYDPKTPEWQGENTILLGPDQYFGHGIGIASSQQIINALNSKRRQGSTTGAYLMNNVVHPDFEYLRSLRGVAS